MDVGGSAGRGFRCDAAGRPESRPVRGRDGNMARSCRSMRTCLRKRTDANRPTTGPCIGRYRRAWRKSGSGPPTAKVRARDSAAAGVGAGKHAESLPLPREREAAGGRSGPGRQREARSQASVGRASARRPGPSAKAQEWGAEARRESGGAAPTSPPAAAAEEDSPRGPGRARGGGEGRRRPRAAQEPGSDAGRPGPDGCAQGVPDGWGRAGPDPGLGSPRSPAGCALRATHPPGRAVLLSDPAGLPSLWARPRCPARPRGQSRLDAAALALFPPKEGPTSLWVAPDTPTTSSWTSLTSLSSPVFWCYGV